jgi:hypothetical protein
VPIAVWVSCPCPCDSWSDSLPGDESSACSAISFLVRVLRLAPNSQGPKSPNETGEMTIDNARGCTYTQH